MSESMISNAVTAAVIVVMATIAAALVLGLAPMTWPWYFQALLIGLATPMVPVVIYGTISIGLKVAGWITSLFTRAPEAQPA